MNLNIVFAVDDNGFDMMAVAMYSVVKNNRKHKLDFYVFHRNISEDNLMRLKKLEKKFSNIQIHIVMVDEDRFRNVDVNNKNVTTEAYFRYLAPEILHDKPRALYMDYDMLCLTDLQDLYTTKLRTEEHVGAVVDYVVEHDAFFRDFKSGIGLEEDEHYVNSGLILFDLEKIRRSNIMDLFWSNLQNKQRIIPKKYNIFADQTVMNLTFRKRTKLLDARYNVYTTALEKTRQDDPAIVHFTGSYKPLTYRNEWTSTYDEAYYSYYDECMSVIGGDNHNLVRSTLKRLSREVSSVRDELKAEAEWNKGQNQREMDRLNGTIAHLLLENEKLINQLHQKERLRGASRNLLSAIDRYNLFLLGQVLNRPRKRTPAAMQSVKGLKVDEIKREIRLRDLRKFYHDPPRIAYRITQYVYIKVTRLPYRALRVILKRVKRGLIHG